MAEIHVEKKRGASAWVWVVLLIVLVAAAAFYLWQTGYIQAGVGKTGFMPAEIVNVATLIAGGSHGA